MSFTSIVKNEVSKIDLNEVERIAELSAMILSGADFDDTIKITTENLNIAKRIHNLIKDIYQINPMITMRKGYNYQKNHLYILQIKEKKKKY